MCVRANDSGKGFAFLSTILGRLVGADACAWMKFGGNFVKWFALKVSEQFWTKLPGLYLSVIGMSDLSCLFLTLKGQREE